MRLVLLGPPGAGKGTQGSRLARSLGGSHVSTGSLLRRLIASSEDSPLVREAREIIAGKFVSDAFANQLALGEIADTSCFVLDGYPRTTAQAATLDQYLAERGEAIDRAIHLEIGAEALAARLAQRRICARCGAAYHLTAFPPRVEGSCDDCAGPLILRPEDDQPEKVALRLALYRERTEPVIAYYGQRDRLSCVCAESSADEVFAAICAVIKSLV